MRLSAFPIGAGFRQGRAWIAGAATAAALTLAAPAQAADASPVLFACPGLAAGEDGPGPYDAEALVQGRNGWFFRASGGLGWDFHVGAEAARNVRRLTAALAARGARLGFVQPPPRGLVYHDQAIRSPGKPPILTPDEGAELYRDQIAALRRAGAVVPDLLAAADKRDGLLYFRRDIHWTPEFARTAAQAFGREYRKVAGDEGLDAVTFKTTATVMADLKGALAQAISRYCADTIPPETYQRYETRRDASGAADLGLFDAPDDGFSVALLGSSFSYLSEWFNFDGFLSEALGASVANHAIAGGALAKSAISYFSSAGFQEDPPNLVVWEAPAYYDLNKAGLAFRQIIPAVHGACAEEAAVAANAGQISNAPASLAIPADAGASGPGNYLFLEAQNRAFVKFAFRIDYADGAREEVPIDRSDRYLNEGRFFLELSPDIDAPATTITILPADATPTSYAARICAAPKEARQNDG